MHDVAIIGSGFGGSVAALRLAEQGRSVVVLERGRRHAPDDYLAARRDPRRYLWEPALGLTRGFFWQRVFRHVGIIGATGVGGGSIVWAGVLLEPGTPFFADPAWAHLHPDWRDELAPHYETAARMLGRTPAPLLGEMDEHLRAAARAAGREDSFGPTPMAIWFGQEGVTVPDPFFGGAASSARSSCCTAAATSTARFRTCRRGSATGCARTPRRSPPCSPTTRARTSRAGRRSRVSSTRTTTRT
jgi:cholesterol oxidase